MNRTCLALVTVALTVTALAGCGRKEVDTSMTSGAPSAGLPASAPMSTDPALIKPGAATGTPPDGASAAR